MSEKSNPRIEEYFKATNYGSTFDSTPWCSAFVCWCLEQAGIKSPRSARAKDFLNWGRAINKDQVKRGDIVVFTRDNGGHVAFFDRWSSDPSGVYVLGGNQNNEVNISKFNIANVIGYRRL